MNTIFRIGKPVWYAFGDGCYCEWSGVITDLFYCPEEDSALWAEVTFDGIVVPRQKSCCSGFNKPLETVQVWAIKLRARKPKPNDNTKRLAIIEAASVEATRAIATADDAVDAASRAIKKSMAALACASADSADSADSEPVAEPAPGNKTPASEHLMY